MFGTIVKLGYRTFRAGSIKNELVAQGCLDVDAGRVWSLVNENIKSSITPHFEKIPVPGKTRAVQYRLTDEGVAYARTLYAKGLIHHSVPTHGDWGKVTQHTYGLGELQSFINQLSLVDQVLCCAVLMEHPQRFSSVDVLEYAQSVQLKLNNESKTALSSSSLGRKLYEWARGSAFPFFAYVTTIRQGDNYSLRRQFRLTDAGFTRVQAIAERQSNFSKNALTNDPEKKDGKGLFTKQLANDDTFVSPSLKVTPLVPSLLIDEEFDVPESGDTLAEAVKDLSEQVMHYLTYLKDQMDRVRMLKNEADAALKLLRSVLANKLLGDDDFEQQLSDAQNDLLTATATYRKAKVALPATPVFVERLHQHQEFLQEFLRRLPEIRKDLK